MYTHMPVYIYIYIYTHSAPTANLRTETLDFGVSDSSAILTLKGWHSHVRDYLPEGSSQAIFVGIIFVERLGVCVRGGLPLNESDSPNKSRLWILSPEYISLSIYICIYIYIYIYMYNMCIYIYIYMCISLSISIYLSIYLSLSLYIYIYISIHLSLSLSLYIYICITGTVSRPPAPELENMFLTVLLQSDIYITFLG